MQQRRREATVTLFKSRPDARSEWHGEVEVHEDIPKGAKLSIDLYLDTSIRGTQYMRGPVRVRAEKPAEKPAEEPAEEQP